MFLIVGTFVPAIVFENLYCTKADKILPGSFIGVLAKSVRLLNGEYKAVIISVIDVF